MSAPEPAASASDFAAASSIAAAAPAPDISNVSGTGRTVGGALRIFQQGVRKEQAMKTEPGT
eukprot:4784209-Prorocentrum_lima.AAC.1